MKKLSFWNVASVALAVMMSSPAAHAQTTVGATTPFTTYEAEAGTLAGGATVVAQSGPETVDESSPQLEASGRAFVSLTATGQSVTWTNKTTQNIGAITVRFCIPDSATGGGTTGTLDLYVNGTLRQVLTMSSAQTWLYGGFTSNTQTPATGNPWRFWDELPVIITETAIAPGSTITLQKDSTNTAAFYYIDCVDVEPLPAPLTQPANSLSILTYGAVANNSSVDSTTAIQDCIDAAETSGQVVWIPEGTFYLNQAHPGLSVSKTGSAVTIEGAGIWYSTLYHQVPLPNSVNPCGSIFEADAGGCVVENVTLDANALSGANGDGSAGGLNMNGSNWLVNNVWIRHTSTGLWASGTGGTIENSRINNTWGDGININNVWSGVGNNLTVTNNHIRASGDDGIAINSVAYNGSGSDITTYAIMQNPQVTNNTVIGPAYASCMGIYGGENDIVENNLLTDGVNNFGLSVGVFGQNGSALASAIVTGNMVLRCGSLGSKQIHPALQIGTINQTDSLETAYVGSNTIEDAMFEGVHIDQDTGNMVVQNNIVNLPGTTGIIIDSDAKGAGILNGNIVSNLNSGEAALLDNSTNFDLETTSDTVGVPIEASSYNTEVGGIGTQTCSEGGLNLEGLTSGSYTVYNNLNLNGVTTFAIREACWSSGTTLQICLDSATATPVATCTLPPTGGTQTWATATCNLSGITGYHNVYLVNTSSHDHNIEWFAFQGTGGGTVEAASYNTETGGIGTQTCSEGGLNIGGITNGSYTVYNNVDLNGATCFAARIASSDPATTTNAGTISVYLDSPTGTLIGTCPFGGTGGGQNWTTVNCLLNGATGYHNVYLVYNGPLNVEWFAFEGCGNAIEAASENSMSTGMNIQTCSEGGLCLGDISSGNYAVYNNVDLNGMTELDVRTACGNTGGSTITAHLDSPTGTTIGTITVPDTGGFQTWASQSCALSGATGYHNVYLVFSSAVNVEYFAFQQGNSGAIEAASDNSMSTGMNTQTCSEGGLCLGDISNGNYSVYNSVNLTGSVELGVRTACGNSVGSTITVHLDSPTGTTIGTITVPDTGGFQTWATQTCTLSSGATGYHNIYLVYSGAVNVEWLDFAY